MAGGFDPSTLTEAEARVAAATVVGLIADLSTPADAPMAAVRAGFLRHLLLGLPFPRAAVERIRAVTGGGASLASAVAPPTDALEAWPLPVRMPGVRILGADIAGGLDLADCVGAGGTGLPALALESCRIPDPIDLSHARLARFSVRRSWFTAIDAREAAIDGPLDLSQCRAVAGPGAGPCTVRLDGATVDGELTGRGAHLSVGEGEGRASCALSLRSAAVTGAVDLTTQAAGETRIAFQADGGCVFDGARIGGAVRLSGARIAAAGADALSFEAATVGGAVHLDDGFSASGRVHLSLARIGGALDCSSGSFSVPDGDALLADNLRVDGSLRFNGSRITGCVWMIGAAIAGNVESEGGLFDRPGGHAIVLEGATVGGALLVRNGSVVRGSFRLISARIAGNVNASAATFDTPGGMALVGDGLQVGGGVLLRASPEGTPFVARGQVRLLGATIGGSLDCDGGSFAHAGEPAIEASSAHIRGDVLFRIRAGQPCRVEGMVGLTGCRIGGGLNFDGAALSSPGGVALGAENARVDGSVNLCDGFSAAGRVTLIGTTIAVDLNCDAGTFANQDAIAIAADRTSIGGFAFFGRGIRVTGALRLSGARIGGSVLFLGGTFAHPGRHAVLADNVVVDGDALCGRELAIAGGVQMIGGRIGRNLELDAGVVIDEPPGVALTLDGTHVGGRLWLTPRVTGAISLRDVVASTFADLPPGRTVALDALPRMILDGFRYQRLDVPAADADDDGCWDDRLRWLSLQYAPRARPGAGRRALRAISGAPEIAPSRVEFLPQPFVQLARVLFGQGFEDDGRRILIAKRWVEARVRRGRWARGIDGAFGTLFGFGYSSKRALASIALAIALGFAFTVYLNARGALVVDTTPVASVAGIEQAPEGAGRARPAVQLEDGRTSFTLRCADAIDPLVYAADVFIPLVDLRQESKCEVGAAPGVTLLAGEESVYRILKSVYALLGWVLTSLAILTFSGVLRRFDDA